MATTTDETEVVAGAADDCSPWARLRTLIEFDTFQGGICPEMV